jgi:hypothetical protein
MMDIKLDRLSNKSREAITFSPYSLQVLENK